MDHPEKRERTQKRQLSPGIREALANHPLFANLCSRSLSGVKRSSPHICGQGVELRQLGSEVVRRLPSLHIVRGQLQNRLFADSSTWEHQCFILPRRQGC